MCIRSRLRRWVVSGERRCRCGTRLSRYNEGPLCFRCDDEDARSSVEEAVLVVRRVAEPVDGLPEDAVVAVREHRRREQEEWEARLAEVLEK